MQLMKNRWFYLAVVVILILVPHVIGAITGDSPFGVRGRPVGSSVYWQGMLIETFILAILAISYNLLFGFTGVISFGHALFFGLGSYILGIVLQKIGLSSDLGFIIGIIAALVICGA